MYILIKRFLQMVLFIGLIVFGMAMFEVPKDIPFYKTILGVLSIYLGATILNK